MAVAIYYAPDLVWRRVLVEQGGLSISEPRPMKWGSATESASGVLRTRVFASSVAFEIQISDVLDSEARRDLYAFAEWARGGGVFAFSADHTKTVGAWATRDVAPGDTSFPVGPLEWSSLEPSAALPVAERHTVCLWSHSPKGAWEEREVSGFDDGTVTLAEPVTHDLSEGPVLATWRHFYPFLRLRLEALDDDIMVSNGAFQHRWDALLRVEVASEAMAQAAYAPDGPVGSIGGQILSDAYQVNSVYLGGSL